MVTGLTPSITAHNIVTTRFADEPPSLRHWNWQLPLSRRPPLVHRDRRRLFARIRCTEPSRRPPPVPTVHPSDLYPSRQYRAAAAETDRRRREESIGSRSAAAMTTSQPRGVR